MKQETARRWRQIAALGSVGATFAIACAGGDIPPTTDDLRGALATAYGDEAGAGTGGTGGRGGSGGTGGRGGAGGTNNPGGAAGSGGAGGSSGAAGAAGSGNEAGASGSGGAGGAGGGDDCDGFALLAANCANAGCHGPGSGLGNFAESEDAAREFIGVEGTVTCGGDGPLIDPANPEDSVIVQKLSDPPLCGGIMPAGGADPLAQADIDCIVEWIGTLEE